MRIFFIIAPFLALAATATAQVTVTGTTPANNATGVSTTTTLSITFSAPIDTNAKFGPGESLLTNVDNVTGTYWSPDRQTIYVNANLQPAKVYFVMIFSVTPAGGGYLQLPCVTYFTTGSSFPTDLHTVSGAVTAGTSGISPAYAAVALMASPFTGNTPDAFTGAIADGSGNFTIPYVPAGTWYVLAAKEANGDGEVDPSAGDGIGFGDSVTVSLGNVSGVVVPLKTFAPVKYLDVRDPVLAFAEANLPSTRQLRQLFCWSLDSLARSSDWQFVYSVPGYPAYTALRADPFGVNFDQYAGTWDWIGNPRPITNLLSAALPDSVIARAERLGGKAFRADPPSNPQAKFGIYMRGGDLYQSEFSWLITDTSKNYWGVSYQWLIEVSQDSSYSIRGKQFLADFLTGQILNVTGVEDQKPGELPAAFSLDQNYPNPFNPSTSISFSLPVRSRVMLEVYNLIGQKVATLVNGERIAGTHSVTWSPSVPSGVYLYRIEAVSNDGLSQRFLQVRKMVLVK